MSWYRFRGPFDSLKPKKTVKFQVSSDQKSTHGHHKISIRIIIIIIIYYILYTIYYILYTIYYILYTIYYILFTSYCLHHFLSKYTQIWAILRKSWGCSSSVQDVVDTFFQMKMVQDLPETISSSKTKRFKSYEIFTHWPPANTVTNLPQIGFFSKSGFSR